VLVDDVGVIDCARNAGVLRRADAFRGVPVDEAKGTCSKVISGFSGRQGLSFLMMVSNSRSVVRVAAAVVDGRRIPW
jgi:hypothetical protein